MFYLIINERFHAVEELRFVAKGNVEIMGHEVDL